MTNFICVLNMRCMYKIDRRGEGVQKSLSVEKRFEKDLFNRFGVVFSGSNGDVMSCS